MRRLFSPKTLDDYSGALAAKRADPDNIDIIMTTDLVNDFVIRVAALEDKVEYLMHRIADG